ncbi:MAG: PfkB family carbohydrate kinase [Aquiluna sp.]
MILVIGEALIDLIGRSSDEGRYQAVVGGANANVALALAVRGEKQAFLGRISTDGFGQQIRNHLASHGVNLEHSVVASQQTTLAVATIDNQGVASYSFYTKDTADWGWQPQELPSLDKLAELGVTTIQYGCLGMAIGPGNKVIEGWLREVSNQIDITLSHDLNIRPALGFSRDAELERVLGVNTFSDIIKASDADIEWLYGLREGEDLDEIANQWSQGKLVLITRGPAGVSIYRDGQRIDVPVQKVALVDTVGAGDTFMATFLAELGKLGALGGASGAKLAGLSDAQLVEAARISTIAAGIVCERVGCQPPTSEEIAARS